jgi:short-subunit dehydrogenase
MNNHTLTGKVVLITGASSGIGRATALALAPYETCLALVSRRKEVLEQVAAQVHELGSQALVIPTDMANPDQVAQMARAVLAEWGQVDILILSQGQYVHGWFNEISMADIDQAMQVNFTGCFWAVKGVLPGMLERRNGHIIFISSLIAKKAIPYDIPYAVSKYALTGLAEALRQELHKTGVYVTTIFPARVATPMIEDLDIPKIASPEPPEAVAKAVLKAIRSHKAEVIFPFKSYLLYYLSVISPSLADRAVRLFHLETRKKSQAPIDSNTIKR